MRQIQVHLNFETFARQMAHEFNWDLSRVAPECSLVEDCGLDSLGMYELLLVLEDYGYLVDEDALFEWETLGDVYAYVLSASNE